MFDKLTFDLLTSLTDAACILSELEVLLRSLIINIMDHDIIFIKYEYCCLHILYFEENIYVKIFANKEAHERTSRIKY